MWKDATLRDRYAFQQLVQLVVVANGQKNMTRNNTMFFVVAGSVSCQFQYFGAQVLEHGGQVDGGDSRNAPLGDTLSQIPVETTDGELNSGTG
jgi:hypothetical protein